MLKDILAKHGFGFNKQFGQNFISDTNLLNAIVADAGVQKNDTVIEIGAGAGALTTVLSSNCRRLISFEIDKNLQPVLNEVLQYCHNVEMNFCDVMKVPMASLDDMAGVNYKVVANLPYYITTPIIMSFVEDSTRVDSLTIMVQKEVAERLQAKCNNKDYGAVTVAVQAVADVKITRIVGRNMFYPQPNVDSAVVVIRFNRAKYDICDREFFRKVVRASFSMRRKTLQNNLLNALDLPREKTIELLNSMNINANIRGEALSVEQFVQLTNKLYKIY